MVSFIIAKETAALQCVAAARKGYTHTHTHTHIYIYIHIHILSQNPHVQFPMTCDEASLVMAACCRVMIAIVTVWSAVVLCDVVYRGRLHPRLRTHLLVFRCARTHLVVVEVVVVVVAAAAAVVAVVVVVAGTRVISSR